MFCAQYHRKVLPRIPILAVESDQFYLPALYFVPEFNVSTTAARKRRNMQRKCRERATQHWVPEFNASMAAAVLVKEDSECIEYRSYCMLDDGRVAFAFRASSPQPPPFSILLVYHAHAILPGILQERLTALFPDGRAFLHIGRFLLHPNNKIWLRITRYHSSYLAHHNRLVGIQVRASM